MRETPPDFGEIWCRWVMPLAGRRISGLNGLTNKVVSIDWGGVVRISRNDLESRIPIEPFRWAIGQIEAHGAVERKAIHRQYPNRYSSGIQLVLEQVPILEAVGHPAVIRLRADWQDRIS